MRTGLIKTITIALIIAMAMTGFAFADVTDSDESGGAEPAGTFEAAGTQDGATDQTDQNAPADQGAAAGQTDQGDPGDQTEPDPVIVPAPELTVTTVYNNKAMISWTKTDVAAGYELYKNGSRISTLTGLQYLDRGLRTGATYQYKVRAYYTEEGVRKYTDFSEEVSYKGAARNPLLLMVDNRSDNRRVVTQFAKVGVTVVTVYNIKDVDPAKYDGLIIPGGGNMDPRSYRAKRDKHTYGTDKAKDDLQIAAILMFAKAGKPVLGICRGSQVINVAFGGTLKQHIPRWHKKNRKVKTVKGSWVRGIYGKKSKVYHWHHQCIKKLGKGLKVTARDARDKRIEAIQHKTLPIYGVQWHPDIKPNKKSYALYNSFKQICLNNMAK